MINQYSRFNVIGANLKTPPARQAVPDFWQFEKLIQKSQVRHAYKFLGSQTTGGDIHRALEIA
jgi:hypothetical protein